jgi:hypothetical protein
LFDESLRLRRELEDPSGIAHSLHYLGRIACDEGNYTRARARYRESLTLWQELGDRTEIAESLDAIAGLVAAEGNGERARRHSVSGVAGAGGEGPGTRAARLFGAAEALREEVDAPLLPGDRACYERGVAAARQTLSEDMFEAAWGDGRGMPLGRAIALALAETCRS